MKIQPHKFISAALLGVLFGLYIHHTYLHWNRLGRAAFLEHEAHRFDRYMAVVAPPASSVLGGLSTSLAIVCAYELISLGLAKIINSRSSAGQNS